VVDQRLADVEARVEALTRRVQAIEARVEEARGVRAPAAGDDGVAATASAAPDSMATFEWSSLADLPLAIGRACLILSGAYLLRAASTAGHWPSSWGALAGIAYASIWWLAAHRAMGREQRLSGATYGWCASLIAFPLLWEATGSLAALSYASAAGVWTAFMLGALAIGVRHASSAVLAGAVGLGLPIGAALVWRAEASWAWIAGLLVCALFGLLVGRGRHGEALCWVPSWIAAATAILLTTAGLTVSAPPWLAASRVFAVEWAWVAAVLVYWVIRRVVQGAALSPADGLLFAATGAVLQLGSLLPRPESAMGYAAAGVIVVLAVFGWMLRGASTTVAPWLWDVMSLLLLLRGSALALTGTARDVAWAALALAGAAAVRTSPSAAWLAPVFGASLAWTSGVLALGLGAVDPRAGDDPRMAQALAIEVVLAASWWILSKRPAVSRVDLLFRESALGLTVIGAAACAIVAVAEAVWLAGADPGAIGMTRAALPTLAALGVLLADRGRGRIELRVVGLAALAAALLQVVARDLVGGSTPAQRFAGFAVIGAGLIGATLILRPRASARVALSPGL
jgi:hypothetical protein